MKSEEEIKYDSINNDYINGDDTLLIEDETAPKWAKEVLPISQIFLVFYYFQYKFRQLLLAIKSIAEDIKEIKNNNYTKVANNFNDPIDNKIETNISGSLMELTLSERIDQVEKAVENMEQKNGYTSSLTSAKDNNYLDTKENIKKFQSACELLIFYGSNIKKNRNIPRYRKLSTNNISYKTTLESIIGHDDVLKSIGFIKNGQHFDWIWNQSSGNNMIDSDIDIILDKYINLLEDLIKKAK